MAEKNLQKIILEEFCVFFEPLETAAASDAGLLNFFNLLGWDINTIQGGYNTTLFGKVREAIDELNTVKQIIQQPPSDFLEIIQSLKETYKVVELISSLPDVFNSAPNRPNDINDLPIDIINWLFCTYLYKKPGSIISVLLFLNIIQHSEVEQRTVVNGIAVRNKYDYRPKIDFNNLLNFIKEPKKYLETLYPINYNSISSVSNSVRPLLEHVEMLLVALDLDTMVGRGRPSLPPVNEDEEKLDGMISVGGVFIDSSTKLPSEVGMSLGLLSVLENGPGFFVVPFGNLNLSTNLADFILTLNADAQIKGLEINKHGILIYDAPGKSDFSVNLSIEKVQNELDDYIIGSVSGSHLRIGQFKVKGGFSVLYGDWSGEISFQFKDTSLILKAQDGDSFLKHVIPGNGLHIDLNLEIGYNNKNGLFFSGGGGLQVEIPIHKKIGGIEIESVVLSIQVLNSVIKIIAATSASLNIGPLGLSIRQVGIGANLGFPNDGGNLGILNLDLGFKPPSGIGITINANPVSGGGFLNYDEATYTYTGGLELNFSKISLKAIGILSTKLPGGADGYSLLIIITAEFTPIQLGIGFTLNGVGGLLGLHRTMNANRLRTGIKDNTLDSILFPKDIVKNANTIISNIGQAFPAKQDRFLIGPMAKIGWGTPTLLTIEIGVIIEMPSPVVLAILGVVKAILPNPSTRVLAIQVNFLGILDFDKKYISFDASLYDSSILTFKLLGDMALRLYWGEKPNFLLSVGGFHPRYTPPPMDLPQMNRLSIILADSNNLKIGIETYFAITSNSVQFGAAVAAVARVWKIEAVGALWFDILFQFSPFYFMADMGAMFAIRNIKNKKVLLQIDIRMSLEGPKPWRAQGKGTFKVLGVGVTVSFDKTFGQARPEVTEAVAVWPRLQQMVRHEDNWSVDNAGRLHQSVSYKEVSLQGNALIADPFGMLSFNQKLVPFDLTITKFGTSAILDFKRFSIDPVTADADVLPTVKNKDHFARNEFFHMTEDEKLTRDSFELFNSGVRIGASDVIASDYLVHKEISYDEYIIDNEHRSLLRRIRISTDVLDWRVNNNYVAQSSYSPSGSRPQAGGPARTQVNVSGFTVVDKNTMSQVSGTEVFANFTEATVQLNSMQQVNPAAREYMIVDTFEL